MRTNVILFLLLACWGTLYPQIPYYRAVEDISFFQQGRALPYALTGGLEAPQFSEIHLNDDGRMDLLIFDRVGAKALPFISVSAPEGSRYVYAPAYEPELPPLNQMVKVLDLNCDGLLDLLTTEVLSSAADVALKVYLRQPAAASTTLLSNLRGCNCTTISMIPSSASTPLTFRPLPTSMATSCPTSFISH